MKDNKEEKTFSDRCLDNSNISRINRFLVIMPIPSTCDITAFVDEDIINTLKKLYGIKNEWVLNIVTGDFKTYETIREDCIILEAFNYNIHRALFDENYILCQMWAPEELVGREWVPNPAYQVDENVDFVSIQNLVCDDNTGKWMICVLDDGNERFFPKITHCLEVLNHWFISLRN